MIDDRRPWQEYALVQLPNIRSFFRQLQPLAEQRARPLQSKYETLLSRVLVLCETVRHFDD